VNWKKTLRKHIEPFLSGDVLEIGAGMGATTKILLTGLEDSWTCLEPDSKLAERIRCSGLRVNVEVGTLKALKPKQVFDTVVYVDVLEHIENDKAEVATATGHLKPGGHLVILCPAHQFLFSPFDRAVGHFRRYNRKTLRRLQLAGLAEVCSKYLDSAGFFASAANRIWLSQDRPSIRQIVFWDKFLVPISRLLDPVFGYSLGKSILTVYRKT
jgi:SAM-dependent methyltransferase